MMSDDRSDGERQLAGQLERHIDERFRPKDYDLAAREVINAARYRHRGFSSRAVLTGSVAAAALVLGLVVAANLGASRPVGSPASGSAPAGDASPTERLTPSPSQRSNPTATTSVTPATSEPTAPASLADLPVSDCPPIPPAALPDGSPPGAAQRSSEFPTEPVVEWGSGQDRVIQFPGHRSTFDPSDPAMAPEEGQTGEVRGHRALLLVDVDPPMGPQLGLPSVGWMEADGCPYIVYLSSGTTLEELEAFAASY